MTIDQHADAATRTFFVSGWRPSVGWICLSGFALQYVLAPVLTWVAALYGSDVAFPQMNSMELVPILIGTLGLGGLRTAEKLAGVAK